MLSLGLVVLVGCNPETSDEVSIDNQEAGFTASSLISSIANVDADSTSDKGATGFGKGLGIGRSSLPFHLPIMGGHGHRGGKRHGKGKHGGKRGGKKFAKFADCVKVTKSEGNSFPKTIDMVFEGECGPTNKQVKGSVSVKITGKRATAGSQKIVTYKDLTINGYKYNGTETTTFVSKGNVTSTLTNGKITTPDGKVVDWTYSRARKQTAGADTDDRSDDVFELSGNTSGVKPDGTTYSVKITTPIIKSKACDWVAKGVVESIIKTDKVVLDFGNGTCDDKATKTVNGKAETITLKKRGGKKHHNCKK